MTILAFKTTKQAYKNKVKPSSVPRKINKFNITKLQKKTAS